MIIGGLFLIAACTGAIARAFLAGRLNHPGHLAWGTLVVNVTGSFALGLVAGSSPEVATVIGVGLLGSFTTFSSFARDLVSAIEVHQRLSAAAYLLASLAGSIGAASIALSLRGV